MGTDPQRYLAHLELRGQHPAVQQLEQLFFAPVAALFSHHFGLPLEPLISRNGSPLPGWRCGKWPAEAAFQSTASRTGIPST